MCVRRAALYAASLYNCLPEFALVGHTISARASAIADHIVGFVLRGRVRDDLRTHDTDAYMTDIMGTQIAWVTFYRSCIFSNALAVGHTHTYGYDRMPRASAHCILHCLWPESAETPTRCNGHGPTCWDTSVASSGAPGRV